MKGGKMVHIKSSREIELMRKTCQLAALTLHKSGEMVAPGISTEDINQFVHRFITENGAYPSPLNYEGFPKSVCTSPNHVICHGIPSAKDILRDTDILNIDVTTYLNKFHGDTNRTFVLPNASDEAKKLVRVAWECMMAGIGEAYPGKRLGDIGAVIQEIAEGHGYSVVRDYCGHGIGRNFHEEPQVLHFGKRGTGLELRPGMTFTIEPMVNAGTHHGRVLKDKWTVITSDGKLSAQFEHTILITEGAPEILTVVPGIYDATTPPCPELPFSL